MHRVIARTRTKNVPESEAKAFVPDGKRQILGEYKVYWQQFDTEAEARALIMRSIMNLHWWKADEMRLKLIDFLYRDYYCTDDVFVTYDNTEVTNKTKDIYATETRDLK
jgi:hypothetical protein